MKSEEMAGGDPYIDEFHEMTLLMPETTCATCYAEFLDAEDLDLHVKHMHSVLSRNNCQFCNSTYANSLEYAAHIRDTHLMDLRCCRYCTKAFLDGRRLIIHERKHFGRNNWYSCSQCNVKFHRHILLEEHERKQHDNEKDGCFIKCLPFLTAILNFKVVEFLHNSSRKKFICLCHFQSPSLEAHMKHVEKKKCQGYVCDLCSGLFRQKKHLARHLKYTKKCLGANDYKDDKVTVCTDCGIEVHVNLFKEHKKNCKAFRCADCGTVCQSIDELSSHQRKEHPLDMNVIRCTFCLKEFHGQLPLKKHIVRVHKPNFHLYKYKCVECDVIFKHPQKLFAHFFTRHKNLQPYTCKICDKKFRVRKSFTLHIKLDHQSVGFVEFNDKYHVFFTAIKSDKPFTPECVVPHEMYNLDSDDGTQKESDTNATEAETEEDKKPVKRKLKAKQRKSKLPKNVHKTEPVLIYSSDDEPLVEVRKRAMKRKMKLSQPWKKNFGSKNLFSCEVCNKNCYTYQNYQNHMSLHNKNPEVECVKCLQKFHSKNDLTKHINKEHASSKLTETLKNILQKKKLDDVPIDENIPTKKPEKFTISLKKVEMDKSKVPATIKAVDEIISVKNFLENFTPDVNEAPGKAKAGLISITPCTGSKIKPMIKLTKFKEEPMLLPISLKMPERFKHEHYVKTNVSVKLIEQIDNESILPDYPDHNYVESFQDYDNDGNNMDVAHEISLEGTEEFSKVVPTKIVIPKMPKGSKIHVATMDDQAPYFKIIKVDADDINEEKDEPPKSEFINLAGGKRLVTANPLAHLLGDTPLKKIMKPLKNKHYKPVVKDFQGMLAQAMNKLDEPPMPRKRKPKVKQSKNTE